MGNSGSAHSPASISNEHNNYRHPPSQWSQSIPRDSTNRHTHQIKVLPELKGGARLRATNNGNILHGGGTLSGRKDSVLHNGVFRTRSTSSTRSPDPSEQNARVSHPHQLMQRSQTQLNIIRKQPGLSKLPENNPFKRFGSEPDLRGSGDERNGLQKESNKDKNDTPKAKLIRNRKKKAAPLPPVQAKANQMTMERKSLNYDPSRFGWKKQDEKGPVPNKENAEEKEAPKKLRLFKTKAEKQKATEVTVTPKEMEKSSLAENHLSRYGNIERQSFNSLPYHQDARHAEFDRLSDHHEESVPPMPLFRREKSFDLSLLMQQKQANLSINSFANKVSQLETSRNKNNQRSIPVNRMSSVESKVMSRKFSQPVTSYANSGKNAETDFKTELLAATRRRSQNIVLKINGESPVVESKMLSKSCEDLDNQIGTKAFERSNNKLTDDMKHEDKRCDRKHSTKEGSEERHQHQQVNEAATKTFYFGMPKDQSMHLNDELAVIHKSTRDLLSTPNHYSILDSESTDSSLSSALLDHFPMHLIQTYDEHLNDPDSNPNGIQVHMRPTLPRRQYEIPRFSPSAAWKNLSQDCDIAASQDETTNVCDKQNYSSYSANAIDEQSLSQQLLESRIERVYREPIPGFLDNKSGDSGISGDAGILQEHVESPNVRDTQNNDKIGPFLLPWTPLQDLGEESSSDDAEMANSKEELTNLVNRGSVFSLSLPRESHLLGYGGENLQLADVKTFNSLQKLKRTVSSAFGGSNDSREQNKPPIYHNDNWMLSRSAPNSIDNNLFTPVRNAPSEFGDDNDDFVEYEEDRSEHHEGIEENKEVVHNNEYRSNNRRPRQQTQTEHNKILPPSFNYLTGGKHLMYLPNKKNGNDETDNFPINRRYAAESNVSEKRSPKSSKNDHQQDLQDPPEFALNLNGNCNQQLNGPEPSQYAFKIKNKNSSKSRNHHRFTFQSTVRQIERKRLAEQLSKDAEQKEAQRLSELEAMRRVEEEFQKKRAREKASIRHQLRLYSLGENEGDVMGYTTGHYTSLPLEYRSNGPRDEPDGAVSSPVPSPTSKNYLSAGKSADNDAYVDTKTPYISRLIEQKSGKLYRSRPNSTKNNEVKTPPTEVLSEFHTARREYVEYRNSRKASVNKSAKSGSHSLSPVTYKTSSDDQPSDNYRKSFAHGRSICSSDSDMSGPIIRSATRHKHRSRSPSPDL